MGVRQWVAAAVALLHAGSSHDPAQARCPARSLAQELWPPPPLSTAPGSFPTSNRLLEADVSRIRESLAAEGTQAPPPGLADVAALVSFYWAPACPFSRALRPVLECLPKFFPPSVRFVAVDRSRLPSTLQLNSGVLATPLVRVSARGKRWKYEGSRRLQDLLQFVERHSGVPAIADVGALEACGSQPACACALEATPVTAADIAELGNNAWMLLAVLFLAGLGGQRLLSSSGATLLRRPAGAAA